MGQPTALMDRFNIHHFATIDSTQTEARKKNYKSGDVLLADIQTAGYGRRGRAWEGPSGNLATTMIEDWHGTEQLAWLGYAVGLGLYDAISPLLQDGAELNLKWPNDLLIDRQKLSGILLEVDNDHVLIGIGMNIAVKPETDQPVTCLNDHTKVLLQPIDILKRFLPHYQRWFDIGMQGGFGAMRETWLSRAAFKNRSITARLANGTELTGVFNDIDQQGALVLLTESGHYTVTSADIYLTKKS
jgi:BirA family biotin operon repressor/biotin-[acetyl-CoA-carboxylase] ligase